MIIIIIEQAQVIETLAMVLPIIMIFMKINVMIIMMISWLWWFYDDYDDYHYDFSNLDFPKKYVKFCQKYVICGILMQCMQFWCQISKAKIAWVSNKWQLCGEVKSEDDDDDKSSLLTSPT